MRKTLFIDMDNTLADFNTAFSNKFEMLYGEPLVYDQKSYDLLYQMDNIKDKEKVYLEVMDSKDFFVDIEPYDGAVKSLHTLNEFFDVYICSKPYNRGGLHSARDKLRWLKFHAPFIDIYKQVIFMSDKELLDGKNRILIDDNVEFLNAWSHEAICFAQPYNKDCSYDFRSNDWEEIADWLLDRYV